MKSNYYILFFSLFILIGCSKKSEDQNNTVTNPNDSLYVYLKLIENRTLSEEKTKIITDKVYAILNKSKNDSINRSYLIKVIQSYSDINEFDNTNKALKLLLKNSLVAKDNLNIANAYYYYATNFFNEGVSDSSYFYYLKAEKLFLKTNQYKVLADIYLKKSRIQIDINDVSGAEKSAIQSLKNSRKIKDKLVEYDALTNLGIVSNETDNFYDAIDYHNKALKIAEDNNLNPEYLLLELSLNNIGNTYLKAKKYNDAIFYFKKALENKNLLYLKPRLYATLLDNVAYSKFKIKDKKELPDLFLKSLRIRDSLKLDSYIIDSKIHLSEYYFENKDSITAQKYAKEAFQKAKLTKSPIDVLSTLKQIALVEHKNSAEYSKEYIKISDSLQQEDRKSKDRFARIAFETDEILQEKGQLEETNRNYLYYFLGTICLFLLVFVIRTQRAKNRELIYKQQQQQANEEIYNLMISQQATIEESRVQEKKKIAQDLHDGVLGRMFGVRLNLDSLNRNPNEEAITLRYTYLSELKQIEQDIREISHDLSREKKEVVNNFVAIVQNLIEDQGNLFEPTITLSIDESIQWNVIDNTSKINLFRILQESLQNINKYAKAKNINVSFEKNNESILLRITDDGIGFDVDSKKKGIGLQNMIARTKECDGFIEVKSKKDKGTTVSVSIPIERTKLQS